MRLTNYLMRQTSFVNHTCRKKQIYWKRFHY